MEPIKVCIGIPSYKGPHVDVFDQHYEVMHYFGRLQERSLWMQRHAMPNDHVPLDTCKILPDAELRPGEPAFRFYAATHTKNSLIGQARDYIVRKALDYGCDYVFFFDDDMTFGRDAFLRLWRHQLDFVGALAFTAREPIAPVLYKFKRDWDFANLKENVDIDIIRDYPKDALFQLDAIGTGVVLIKTDVFRRLGSEPWFNGSVSAGEDIHFAWKCAQVGIKIHCDTSVKTNHVPNQHTHMMNEEYYEQAVANDSDTHVQQLQAIS